MNVSVIILAAGIGSRMNTSINKQFLILNNQTILAHTIKVFISCSDITEIILVTKETDFSFIENTILPAFSTNISIKLIEGGKERTDSVENGINAIKHEDIVLIHDGARPFVTVEEINNIVQGVINHDIAILGVPVKDTIKILSPDGYIDYTPDRRQLYSIQTPQGFKVSLIKEAYRKISSYPGPFWDDAMLLEKTLNKKAFLVEGSYENIKITTPIDLIIGKQIQDNRS